MRARRYHDFRADPDDAQRVWCTMRVTATHTGVLRFGGVRAEPRSPPTVVESPPEAVSLRFCAETGKLRELTTGYPLDRRRVHCVHCVHCMHCVTLHMHAVHTCSARAKTSTADVHRDVHAHTTNPRHTHGCTNGAPTAHPRRTHGTHGARPAEHGAACWTAGRGRPAASAGSSAFSRALTTRCPRHSRGQQARTTPLGAAYTEP